MRACASLTKNSFCAWPAMIVGRMERLQVDHLRPAVLVLDRDRERRVADLVLVGRRPAVRSRDDGDPLGPQRVELGRSAARVADDLDVAVAVQQQLRRERLEQRLAGARRRDQPLLPTPSATIRTARWATGFSRNAWATAVRNSNGARAPAGSNANDQGET